MPFRIADIIKQFNRSETVTTEDFFFALDSADINHVVSGMSTSLGLNDQGVTGLTANIRFIVDDIRNLDASILDDVGSDGNGDPVLATGDIVRVIEFDRRNDSYRADGTQGATYQILFSASNTGNAGRGENSQTPYGQKGVIVFNEFDQSFYGYQGATWEQIGSGRVDGNENSYLFKSGGAATGDNQIARISNTRVGVSSSLEITGDIVLNATGNYVQFPSGLRQEVPYRYSYGSTKPATAITGDKWFNAGVGLELTYLGNEEGWVAINVGAPGPTGNTGEQGSVSDKGMTGATGLVGPTGEQGPTGDPGPQGLTGMTGMSGATGATGVSGSTGDDAGVAYEFTTGSVAGSNAGAGKWTYSSNGNLEIHVRNIDNSNISDYFDNAGSSGSIFLKGNGTNTFHGARYTTSWNFVAANGGNGKYIITPDGSTFGNGSFSDSQDTRIYYVREGLDGTDGQPGSVGPTGDPGLRGNTGLTGQTGMTGTIGTVTIWDQDTTSFKEYNSPKGIKFLRPRQSGPVVITAPGATSGSTADVNIDLQHDVLTGRTHDSPDMDISRSTGRHYGMGRKVLTVNEAGQVVFSYLRPYDIFTSDEFVFGIISRELSFSDQIGQGPGYSSTIPILVSSHGYTFGMTQGSAPNEIKAVLEKTRYAHIEVGPFVPITGGATFTYKDRVTGAVENVPMDVGGNGFTASSDIVSYIPSSGGQRPCLESYGETDFTYPYTTKDVTFSTFSTESGGVSSQTTIKYQGKNLILSGTTASQGLTGGQIYTLNHPDGSQTDPQEDSLTQSNVRNGQTIEYSTQEGEFIYFCFPKSYLDTASQIGYYELVITDSSGLPRTNEFTNISGSDGSTFENEADFAEPYYLFCSRQANLAGQEGTITLSFNIE